MASAYNSPSTTAPKRDSCRARRCSTKWEATTKKARKHPPEDLEPRRALDQFLDQGNPQLTGLRPIRTPSGCRGMRVAGGREQERRSCRALDVQLGLRITLVSYSV